MRIIVSAIALAAGTVFIAAPALAQPKQTTPSYSNVGTNGAPLSPGGISAAASAFGGPGPGYIGPVNPSPVTKSAYSNTGTNGAPLSPNGISAAASAFGGPGPGYIGPAAEGKGLYASVPQQAPAYSNTGPRGAPLSPNGIGAAADSFGGPGYQ